MKQYCAHKYEAESTASPIVMHFVFPYLYALLEKYSANKIELLERGGGGRSSERIISIDQCSDLNENFSLSMKKRAFCPPHSL